MTPFLQSSGIISVCQIAENWVWRNRSIVGPVYFSSSELKPRIPAALLFLSLLIAFRIFEGLKCSYGGTSASGLWVDWLGLSSGETYGLVLFKSEQKWCGRSESQNFPGGHPKPLWSWRFSLSVFLTSSACPLTRDDRYLKRKFGSEAILSLFVAIYFSRRVACPTDPRTGIWFEPG